MINTNTNTGNVNTDAKPCAASYMKGLQYLPDSVKVELIHLLSLALVHSDIQVEENKDVDLMHCFSGDWGNGIPTEEYCKMLRGDGVNTIDIEN